MRILFAACVLLSHAPENTDGNASRELLTRLTHALSFGSFGVDGFFLLSGYLIVKSWQRSPGLGDYLRRRILRIVPGYVVAVVLSVVIVGLIAPAVPRYFTHFGLRFWGSVLMLSSPLTPPVFPGLPNGLPNGALWTISYECRCYLLVALFGLCGWLRRPLGWAAATVVFLGLNIAQSLHKLPEWHTLLALRGDPDQIYRLASAFFVGGCFYLFEKHIQYRRAYALLAIAAIVLADLRPHLFETVLIACGGYLLFYLMSLKLRWLAGMDRFPDISYGLYLYGSPVEMLLIWHYRTSPWITFAAALAICIPLGWLSWHFIERPMLALKPRPSAPLPAA